MNNLCNLQLVQRVVNLQGVNLLIINELFDIGKSNVFLVFHEKVNDMNVVYKFLIDWLTSASKHIIM